MGHTAGLGCVLAQRQRCTPQLCKVFLESHRALTIARSVSPVQGFVMAIKNHVLQVHRAGLAIAINTSASNLPH